MSYLTTTPSRVELREQELRFIEACRKIYGQVKNREEWDLDLPRGSALDYANLCYFEGRLQEILTGTFEQFLGYLGYEYFFSIWGTEGYHKRQSYCWRNRSFYERHGVGFREGMKFVRKPHHKKKVQNEEEVRRRAWREARGMDRDKCKHKGWRSGKAGRWNKQNNHRNNRRWARQRIAARDFDCLTQAVQDIQRVWWD